MKRFQMCLVISHLFSCRSCLHHLHHHGILWLINSTFRHRGSCKNLIDGNFGDPPFFREMSVSGRFSIVSSTSSNSSSQGSVLCEDATDVQFLQRLSSSCLFSENSSFHRSCVAACQSLWNVPFGDMTHRQCGVVEGFRRYLNLFLDLHKAISVFFSNGSHHLYLELCFVVLPGLQPAHPRFFFE